MATTNSPHEKNELIRFFLLYYCHFPFSYCSLIVVVKVRDYVKVLIKTKGEARVKLIVRETYGFVWVCIRSLSLDFVGSFILYGIIIF